MKPSLRIPLMLSLLFTCLLLLSACLGNEGEDDTHTGAESSDVPVDSSQSADSETAEQPVTEEESHMESQTEPMTLPETEAPTEPPTEPETDPVREPLELACSVDPYIPDTPAEVRNIKAMWLSQFDLQSVYTNGGKIQRDENDFRTLISTILNHVKANGFNTVIVQVRPNADSMYPSEYYPPSMYVTGSYANAFSYDPFPIIIEEARYLGLSVHAWINPLRGETDAEMQLISTDFLIRQWYDDDELRGKYLVQVSGRWYLNPAYAEVRDLIVHGAREILQTYEVDGVHMDDYFYPTTDASFDKAAYTAYQSEGGSLSLADWRRENLNALVSSLYRTVKMQNADAWFGISPSSIINTVYNNQFADVYRWCAEPGFVDYILPQVYFGFEHATAPFDKICDTWDSMVTTDYVTLLIGMTFGKALSKTDQWAGASGSKEWATHTDILARSVQYTQTLHHCQGISVFCYQYFYHPVTGVEVAETKAERDNFTSALAEARWDSQS